MCDMRRSFSVGERELRQNLSVHPGRVKRRETLTADALKHLVDGGRVVPARRPLSALPAPLPVRLRRPVSALLDELRKDSI
jgi:hypothetical protein